MADERETFRLHKLRFPRQDDQICPIFRIFSNHTGIKLINSGLKEAEPTVKVGLCEPDLLMKPAMYFHRIALVAVLAQQKEAPESIHLWQMMFPVDTGDVVEDIADDIVFPDFGIEGIDQLLDIVVGGDVGFHGYGYT